MEKPKMIKCPNPDCFEGTIEITNGAETSTGICPVCNGTEMIEKKVETMLSVCMIVGKEEGNLKRCLDSILPITYQDWCELIIVCTQKGDRTQEVAEHYADVCVYQEWEANFSKHRNYSVSFAKGKFILIIDADEELDQRSLYLLEEMVLNPEYSEYNAMFINVVNYLKKDRTAKSVAQQPRIFANPNGEPLYEGAAHNKALAKEPYFIANNVNLNHYGYIFEGNDDLKQQKLDRTLPLLLREYEDDKTSLHALTHLIKTYQSQNMHKEVMQYSKSWMKLMRKAKKDGTYGEGWAAYNEVFNIFVASCIMAGDIKKALKFKKFGEEFSDRLPMMAFHIGYYYAVKKNEKQALKFLEEGVSIANKTGGVMEGLTSSHIDMIIDEVFMWLATYYFKHGSYDKAGKYFNSAVQNSQRHKSIRWDIWNEEMCIERLIKN